MVFVLDVVCLYSYVYDALSKDWGIICLMLQVVHSFGIAACTYMESFILFGLLLNRVKCPHVLCVTPSGREGH